MRKQHRINKKHLRKARRLYKRNTYVRCVYENLRGIDRVMHEAFIRIDPSTNDIKCQHFKLYLNKTGKWADITTRAEYDAWVGYCSEGNGR